MNGRRARPTIRCLVNDLHISLPDLDIDLGTIDDPMLEELRRVAPTSPLGQKRILSIGDRMVYRIRHSELRGATWVQEENDIVWLLAVERREEDSSDDAYEYFQGLHENGGLFPTNDDRVRDRAEVVGRFVDRVREEAPGLLENARREPGVDHTFLLGEQIQIRMFVSRDSSIEEVWMAVPQFDVARAVVPANLRDVIFVLFEEALGEAAWEYRADWPSGALEWHEIARLGLREN